MKRLKKSHRITIGLIILAIGVLLLGADRIFVSAESAGNFGASMTILTIVSLFFFLVGAIWLFRTTFD